MTERTALLIRCTHAELAKIRDRADAEYRTVSGYVVNALHWSLYFDELLSARMASRAGVDLAAYRDVPLAKASATLLLRCSKDEGRWIRAAAKRRGMTVSALVRYGLRELWKAQERVGKWQALPETDGASSTREPRPPHKNGGSDHLGAEVDRLLGTVSDLLKLQLKSLDGRRSIDEFTDRQAREQKIQELLSRVREIRNAEKNL